MVEPFSFNVNFAGREPDILTAARVTDQFFSLLGTPPALGRSFGPDEFRPGGPRVAVYSHDMWHSRAAGDPNIVGQLVRLDEGEPYRVVGVLPRGLELRLFNDRGRRPEPSIWLPKQGYADFERTQRGLTYYNVFGRLRQRLRSCRDGAGHAPANHGGYTKLRSCEDQSALTGGEDARRPVRVHARSRGSFVWGSDRARRRFAGEHVCPRQWRWPCSSNHPRLRLHAERTASADCSPIGENVGWAVLR
jgi:hypothetical protein